MPAKGIAALEYEEPPSLTILILSSFLWLLNVSNWLLDSLLYCGLLGQILVGIAWGTPGATLLDVEVERAVVQLGYIGLILLVFEGGLSTSFQLLKANAVLSVTVAATGITAPIALSFVLIPLAGASYLECFAAGAALCSTSLATTFAVLRACNLTSTRIGVVLSSAAMLDDVVGLVMVEVISDIGQSGASISAVTVVRPVLVSIAFALCAVILCRFVVAPITVFANSRRAVSPRSKLNKVLQWQGTPLTIHTALLVALVASSSYAGTSNLFAAYLGGAAIGWWDSEVPHVGRGTSQPGRDGSAGREGERPDGNVTTSAGGDSPQGGSEPSASGCETFEKYYRPAVKWVLQPFFFASIGFSIPITRMFTGAVIWRGIVYSVLMAVGKLICGLWLIRFPEFTERLRQKLAGFLKLVAQSFSAAPRTSESNRTTNDVNEKHGNAPEPSGVVGTNPTGPLATTENDTASAAGAQNAEPRPPNVATNAPKPLSIYPAFIVGFAMVARGEIGFLISSIAQSNGVFSENQETDHPDVFIIVIWAIVLCTIVGPLCVGYMVRRVRGLEARTDPGSNLWSGRNVLGVWGVS